MQPFFHSITLYSIIEIENVTKRTAGKTNVEIFLLSLNREYIRCRRLKPIKKRN